MNLPELPDGYRWRIKANHSDPDYDAANVYLEKLHTYLVSGIRIWKHVRGGYVRKTILEPSLTYSAEQEAWKLYEETFGKRDSEEIEGFYYGNNSNRSEQFPLPGL